MGKSESSPLTLGESLIAAVMIAVPAVLLGAFPVAALALLATRLGLEDAGLVLLLDGLISLALVAVPLAARARCRVDLHAALAREDAGAARRIVVTAIALELAIGAAAIGLLAAAAPWLAERVFGRAVPWELVALAAAHAVARRLAIVASAIAAAARKGALAPALLPLFELTVAPVIVAAIATTPRGVLVGDLAFGVPVMLLALAMAWREVARVLGGEPHVADASDARGSVWTPWGNWLESLARGVVRPGLAALAGLAAIVPVAAAGTLQAILVIPLLLVAMTPTRTFATRAVRGLLLAAIAAALSAGLGPTLYRWIYPASIAGGADYMPLLAWTAAALPLSALGRPRIPGREADQRLAAFAALVMAGLLALAVHHGGDLDRLILAWVAGGAVGLVVMFVDRGAASPASSGVQP